MDQAQEQILIDVQLKNNNAKSELEEIRREMEKLEKAQQELHISGRDYVEMQKNLKQELEKTEEAIDDTTKKSEAHAKQIELEAIASERLEKISDVLSRRCRHLSDDLDLAREALSQAHIAMKKMIDAGETDSEVLNRQEAIIRGLEKEIKELTKSYRAAAMGAEHMEDEMEKVTKKGRDWNSIMQRFGDLLSRACPSMNRFTVSTRNMGGALGAALGPLSLLIGLVMAFWGAIKSVGTQMEELEKQGVKLSDQQLKLKEVFEKITEVIKKVVHIIKASLIVALTVLIGTIKATIEFWESLGHAVVSVWKRIKGDSDGAAAEWQKATDRMKQAWTDLKTPIMEAKDTYDAVTEADKKLTKTVSAGSKSRVASHKEEVDKLKELKKILDQMTGTYSEWEVTAEDAKEKLTKMGVKENEQNKKILEYYTELYKREGLQVLKLNELEAAAYGMAKAYQRFTEEAKTAMSQMLDTILNDPSVDADIKDRIGQLEESQLTVLYGMLYGTKNPKASIELVKKQVKEWDDAAYQKAWEDWAEEQKKLYDLSVKNEEKRKQAAEALQKEQEKMLESMTANAKASVEAFFKSTSTDLAKRIGDAMTAGVSEEINQLNEAYNKGLTTKAEYVAKTNELNEKLAKRQRIAAYEQAIVARTQTIFDIWMNYLKGTAAVVGGSPFTIGSPWKERLLALAIGQTAMALAQPIPKAAKGGEVGGNTHAEGGTIVEAEKGEYIVSAQAYAANSGLVGAINSGGGMSFQQQLVSSQKQITDLKEAIMNMKIYATVDSIERATANYNYLKNNA